MLGYCRAFREVVPNDARDATRDAERDDAMTNTHPSSADDTSERCGARGRAGSHGSVRPRAVSTENAWTVRRGGSG